MEDSTRGKIITSPYTVDIPAIDVASFIFKSKRAASRKSPQYFDADRPSRNFSLDQAEVLVKRLARGLEKLGLQPNDKVLLYSPNSLYFPILLWGVIAARCVFTAANPGASETEVTYHLEDSEAKLIIAHPTCAQTAVKAACAAGLSENSVYLFIDPDEVQTSRPQTENLKLWTDIWCSPEEISLWEWYTISSIEEAKSATAILNYSSGTTGTPKGVEVSHYNAVSNSVQVLHKQSLVANTPKGKARKARLDISGERTLIPLPMYHAYGQMYGCINAARSGAKVFIMAKFNLANYLTYLDIYRITFLNSVPVILSMINKHAHPEMYNLKSIETVVSGSAPLNPEASQKFAKLYLRGNATIKQGMGLTETTCSLFQFAPDDEDDGKSIGWLNANCRAKITPLDDQDFDNIPRGATVGEIWVSGPNIVKGYYKKPRQTAETFITDENGIRWLRTGDVGYADERGRFYVVDRIKELIKVKGLQVAPTELELALLEHPDVNDAAVIGAKIDDGEYPRAFVVRKTSTVTAEELQKLIKSRFASHKWLTAGVYFIDAIPRTGSGKIIRRALHKINLDARSSKL